MSKNANLAGSARQLPCGAVGAPELPLSGCRGGAAEMNERVIRLDELERRDLALDDLAEDTVGGHFTSERGQVAFLGKWTKRRTEIGNRSQCFLPSSSPLPSSSSNAP